MGFIVEMAHLAINAGIASEGSTIFWGAGAELPAGDDAFLTLQDTGGTAPILMHFSDTVPAYQRPSGQIVARATSWDDAEALIQLAYNLYLKGSDGKIRRNFTIDGTYYLSIDVKSEPFDLPADEAGRLRRAFNIEAVKRPS